MYNFASAFNPNLTYAFVEQFKGIKPNHLITSRDLFYQLNQSKKYPDLICGAYYFVTQGLAQAKQAYLSLYLSECNPTKLGSLKTFNNVHLCKQFATHNNQLNCIKQTLAIQLTQPCWLQNISQAFSSHEPFASQLTAIYLQLTQINGRNTKLLDEYRTLLVTMGIKIPDVHSYRFSQQSELITEMFDFSVTQLALSCFPRVLFPEIIGFTLAYCQTPTFIENCFPTHSMPFNFFSLQAQNLDKQLAHLRCYILKYIDFFSQHKKNLWLRIQQGFWLYHLHIRNCKKCLRQVLEQPTSTQAVVVSLPKHKTIEPKSPIAMTMRSPMVFRARYRGIYYYLLNADLFPDVLPCANNIAKYWLRLCSLFCYPPFKQYSSQRFNAYTDSVYQHETNNYKLLQGKPKISKAAYIWGIEQVAPMVLIDGCWLQNYLVLQNSHTKICAILGKIYGDEMGNGKLEKNHSYIFQQLLDSLAIKLPAVHSEEFTKHPRFINSAFDLPIYMLSLALFSAEFLPELLGLNMAIELSGLGKDYLGLVDDLNYWGIDSTIAKVHISVDDYACGHAFLAKKAIKLYLASVAKSSGSDKLVNTYWRRIYNGYASLRFVGGRFKLALPFGYLIHKFKS